MKQVTLPIPTFYLKAPFLKIIREGYCKYVLRLESTLVQLQGRQIYLGDSHRTILVSVTRAYRVPIEKVNWLILDSIGYHSRDALRNGLMQLYGAREINDITVLEVVVQPKS
jgi:hypothetical protein